MTMKFSARILGLAFVLSLAAGQVFAQAAKVELPFSFMVAKQELPAGTYEIRVDGSPMKRLTVRNVADGKSVQAPILFRLADMGVTEPAVAFDVTDNVHYLSEVHFPHLDGFALAGSPGEHKHELVKGSK